MNKSFDYAQYLEFAELQNIDPKDRLTEDEFNSPDVTTEKEGGDSVVLRAIVPPNPTPNAVNSAIDLLGKLASTEAGKRIIGSAKSRLSARINAEASKFGQAFNVGESTMPGTGSSSGMGGSSYGSGGAARFNFGMVSMNPVPIKFNLTTPIVPNCYPDYFLDSDSHYNSDCHITGARLTWENMDSKMDSFFSNVLVNELVVKLQQNNKFRINLADMDSANIKEYLESLTVALNCIYCATSIFQYCQPENKHRNLAMFKLRDAFSSDAVERVYEMIRIVATYPIPPRLNEMLWFLNQNYKASENPGSTLLKFIPFSLGLTPNPGFFPASMVDHFNGVMVSTMARLTADANRRVAATLGSAAPSWVNNDVLAPSPEVMFSPNFNTIWANSPFINGGNYSPHVSGPSIGIMYASHAGRLDGAAYGLTAIRNTTSNVWEPSMFLPESSTFSTTNVSNRFAYEQSTNRFDNMFINNALPFQRGECHVSLSYNIPSIPVMPFGAELREGVNIYSVRDTSIQLMEWLFGIDTIKGTTNNSGSSNTSVSQRSSNPKRGRRMKNSTDIVSK
uniref:Uncharacterized protein n=1 Tax=Beihai picobirna-like virus 12 TaxID=1922517 RepID=A0A1L3KLJ2_9VIRU|nr:hypothetical protein [Beihai picobirna-like virus 12]